MFLLLGLALLLFLPSPWGLVALFVCLVLASGEVLFWQRRVRGLRVRGGAETLIGKHATVVAPCRPLGKVSVGGELWAARCADGVDADQDVTIVGRERLVLLVSPGPGDARDPEHA